MNILFDIDRTLFDTDKYYELVKEKLVELLDISEHDFGVMKRSYVSYLEGLTFFDPSSFSKLLADIYNIEEEKIYNIYLMESIYKECNYNDVEDIFEELSRNHRIGILSEGSLSFQTRKLVHLNIFKYLTPELVYLSQNKFRDHFLSTLPQEAVIVDDNIVNLEKLANDTKYKHLDPIFILRNQTEPYKSYKTIHSLRELPDLLATV